MRNYDDLKKTHLFQCCSINASTRPQTRMRVFVYSVCKLANALLLRQCASCWYGPTQAANDIKWATYVCSWVDLIMCDIAPIAYAARKENIQIEKMCHLVRCVFKSYQHLLRHELHCPTKLLTFGDSFGQLKHKTSLDFDKRFIQMFCFQPTCFL